MKILLYVNSHLPRIGGRELVVHNLALQYQKLGHRVVVAGASGRRRYGHLRYGYPVRRWPNVPVLPRDFSRAVALGLTKLTDGFDVVHAHATYPSGYIATRLKRWLACPIVITPHGEDINVVAELGFGQRLDPVQDRKIRFAVSAADRVTSISETITASLQAAGVDPSRITAIPNGVDLERFRRCQPVDAVAKLGFPPQTILVVTVGNYHRRKGHESLIEAVRIARRTLPELRLAIAGNPSDTLREIIARDGLEDAVRLTGMLPAPGPDRDTPDLLAALLKRAAIYVSAGTSEGSEGLSLALLEAMAAGACPVATRISGNRDVIRDEVNGLLVPPSNPAAMAESMIRVACSAELRHRLIDGALVTVSEFDWSRIASRYLDLYEQLRRGDG